MTRDEIREIAEIVGGDDVYRHFVHRINKEFDAADEKRNSNVYVLFQESGGVQVGFCVIGHSPSKMKVWEQTFREEGWVDEDFKIADPAFELMYMYIKPETRKKGLGKSLFRRATSFAKKKGVRAMYAYVSDTDDHALNFYKKQKASILREFSDEDTKAAFLSWQL